MSLNSMNQLGSLGLNYYIHSELAASVVLLFCKVVHLICQVDCSIFHHIAKN